MQTPHCYNGKLQNRLVQGTLFWQPRTIEKSGWVYSGKIRIGRFPAQLYGSPRRKSQLKGVTMLSDPTSRHPGSRPAHTAGIPQRPATRPPLPPPNLGGGPPIVPPVYRPRIDGGRILQSKTAPTAPPAYRPQRPIQARAERPGTAQARAIVPVTPPVYRPQNRAGRIPQSQTWPSAPPAYRPQGTAQPNGPMPATTPAQASVVAKAPPVYRP